ncbi:uncharacterized protein LOC123701050 [Colias croceus]|uniref:uncharacterized protein LOC123701050 n=1 Tax=Colias crocea TaxID=72248 RepID=UPI001E27D176|nr:uncharacterized protein LOC123701050 [Colias croceus]
MTVTILLFYINNYPSIIVLCSTPVSLTLVFSYLPHIILLDLIYIRMKSLRLLFERKFIKFNVIGNEQVKIKIKNTKNCLLVYKKILNNFCKASKEIQLGLMIILLTCYPQMIYFVYETMKLCFKHDYLKAIQRCIKIIQTLTLLFIPAIISELINNEYEQILKSLWKQILSCTDEKLLLETRQAYLYMKLRPFKITIWRAIRLNLSMPISYISVCISHLIVVIQFTHAHKILNQ